jgi:hypothetical protein
MSQLPPVHTYPITAPSISPEAVLQLSSQFATKPISLLSPLGINYDVEARATLNAIAEPAVRHALASLGTLRNLYNEYGGIRLNEEQLIADFRFGLQEYTNALVRLASKLSTETAASIKVALLCCQIFISIETVLSNFFSAAQHFIRGIRIMYQYRTRPYISGTGRVSAPRFSDMPYLDIFFIKLLMSPCPIQRYMKKDSDSVSQVPSVNHSDISPLQTDDEINGPSNFKANFFLVRDQICDIARSTIGLLGKISQLGPTSPIYEVVDEKQVLLEQLERWKDTSKLLYQLKENEMPDKLEIDVGIVILLHLVLKTVLALSLQCPATEANIMEPECNKMMEVGRSLVAMKKKKQEVLWGPR